MNTLLVLSMIRVLQSLVDLIEDYIVLADFQSVDKPPVGDRATFEAIKAKVLEAESILRKML